MKYIYLFNTDCWFTLLVLLFVLLKKTQKNSENDHLTGHFQSFFFHLTTNPKSEKKFP